MHVYISIDMEGVAGVATTNQCRRGTDDYPAARRLMTEEANAAIAGAFDGGATGVVVNDSHGDMANLLPEDLDERAELILGSPKIAGAMMEGIGSQYAVALFIGYHAAAGVQGGVLAHTYSGAFYDVRLNGDSVTEAELNAFVGAEHGVPLGLVTGDQAICAVASRRFDHVRTVAVKQGLGVGVASSMHPTTARAQIREAAAAAVNDATCLPPVQVSGPVVMEVDLATLKMSELCSLVPGTLRSGRTVRFESTDYLEAFSCLRACMYLARAAN